MRESPVAKRALPAPIKLINMSHFCPFLLLLVCSSSSGLSLFLPKIEDQEVRTILRVDKVDKRAESAEYHRSLLVLVGLREEDYHRFTLFSPVLVRNSC